MNTKINFSAKIVAVAAQFSFDEMGDLQEMLTIAAMEAAEDKNQEKLDHIKAIAEKLGIDLEIEIEIEDTPTAQDEYDSMQKSMCSESEPETPDYLKNFPDEKDSGKLPGEPHLTDGLPETEDEKTKHSQDE